jgi:hypothetical protein
MPLRSYQLLESKRDFCDAFATIQILYVVPQNNGCLFPCVYIYEGWAPGYEYKVIKKRYVELSFIYVPNIEVHIVAQEARPVAWA